MSVTDAAGELCFSLDKPLPGPWVIGRGNVLRIQGWCYHTLHEIAQMNILVDGTPHPVADHSLPRPDILEVRPPGAELCPNSLTSGFYADIPFASTSVSAEARLQLMVTLKQAQVITIDVGVLHYAPSFDSIDQPHSDGLHGTPEEPLIAICMITYNPREDWFARQVDSIKAQTYQNWICIINDDCSKPAIFDQIKAVVADDKHFYVYQNEANLGFYKNTERCLLRVPPEAAFIALSDQDDIWFPDKLSSCLAAFEPGVRLVYSDMQIVSEDGVPIHQTYWTTRKNNYKSLGALLFANTVTGAASLFRFDLLADILPFPQQMTNGYHDHWIAAVALATGRINYINRPLYAYRQHGRNIIGHNTPKRQRLVYLVPRLARWLLRPQPAKDPGSPLWNEVGVYYNNLFITSYLAKVLQTRLAQPSRVVDRFAQFDRSALMLFLEGVRLRALAGATLGYPWICLRGLVLRRMSKRFMLRNKRAVFDTILEQRPG